jgi:hypothetical protein
LDRPRRFFKTDFGFRAALTRNVWNEPKLKETGSAESEMCETNPASRLRVDAAYLPAQASHWVEGFPVAARVPDLRWRGSDLFVRL